MVFEVSGRAIRFPGNNERNEPRFREKLLQSFCPSSCCWTYFLKLPASDVFQVVGFRKRLAAEAVL